MEKEKEVLSMISRCISLLGRFSTDQINMSLQRGIIDEVTALKYVAKTCESLNELEGFLFEKDFLALREEFFKIAKSIDDRHKCDDPECNVWLVAKTTQKSGEVCHALLLRTEKGK